MRGMEVVRSVRGEGCGEGFGERRKAVAPLQMYNIVPQRVTQYTSECMSKIYLDKLSCFDH